MLNKQREQNKARQQRYRDKQKALRNNSVTQENVTQDVTLYPPIILALADSVKREKLERIYQSLKVHNVSDQVNYGINGPTFTQVGEMLEALH